MALESLSALLSIMLLMITDEPLMTSSKVIRIISLLMSRSNDWSDGGEVSGVNLSKSMGNGLSTLMTA